eukprot:1558647-Pleurochrysis_carterae.AAC.3
MRDALPAAAAPDSDLCMPCEVILHAQRSAEAPPPFIALGTGQTIFNDDRRKAIYCVSLRWNYESSAKTRVALRGELTLLKTTLIYLL